MTYYHCSPMPDLEVLVPHKSVLFGDEEVVCMSSSYPMSLMYGIKHYEYTYGYRWNNGHPGNIYYEEYYPGALKELYSGKAAFLYICEEGSYVPTSKPGEYVSRSPVRVIETNIIEDLYKTFLDLEAKGQLEIVRYNELSEDELSRIRKGAADEILEKHLLARDSSFSRYMKEKYPGSWQDAVLRTGMQK